MRRNGLLGKKIGMTQIFDKSGNSIPVTVIEAGPCVVVQQRKKGRHGYSAVQLGFNKIKEKRLNKPLRELFKKQKVEPCRYLKEFKVRDEEKFFEGQILTLESFKVGDYVDVTGFSKGKGFQGVIKRHGKSGGPASHGSHFHRKTGSIGQRTSPGEVFKNMKLPGHMGNKKVTVKNLLVAGLEPKDNLLLVRGAVSGGKGALLAIYNRADDYESRIAKAQSKE